MTSQKNLVLLRGRHHGLVSRLLAMMTAWTAVGMLLGASISLRQGSGLVMFASHVLAGMIVCQPLGIALGLFFGRAKLAVWGGLGGMAVGAVLSPLQTVFSPAELAEVALICGAVAGVTLMPYLRGTVLVVKIALTMVRNCRRGLGGRTPRQNNVTGTA